MPRFFWRGLKSEGRKENKFFQISGFARFRKKRNPTPLRDGGNSRRLCRRRKSGLAGRGMVKFRRKIYENDIKRCCNIVQLGDIIIDIHMPAAGSIAC